MTAPVDLDDLNPEQRAAVVHPGGPLLVFAGAGSGKTRVITYRIARLVETGVPPGRIVAMTFTNKAAREMRERVEAMVGPAARSLWLGTFHSLSARLLRLYGSAIGLDRNFVIYDEDDQIALVKRVLKEAAVQEETAQPRAVLNRISQAKERLVGPREFEQSAAHRLDLIVARVYPLYQQALARANALDFDDLVMKAEELLRASEIGARLSERFLHVLVDEYQDVNFAQYRLARALAERHRNLTIVGDDDQSIYSWRGADVTLMLRFTSDYPDATIVKLERNYRSTQTILDAAHEVIRHNRGRSPKRLWTDRGAGPKVRLRELGTDKDEAMAVAQAILEQVQEGRRGYGDFAVLYRTNAQSRVFEEAFLTLRIPHVLLGGQRFYERKEIKDLVAYLRVVVNPADVVSLLRIVNVPARGIGATSLTKLLDRSRERGLGLFEILRDQEMASLVSRKTAGGVRAFVACIEEAQEIAAAGPVKPVVHHLLNRSGYLSELKAQGTPEALDRLENLQQLLAVADEYDRTSEEPSLADFLQGIALLSDVDELDASSGRVTLMTVHSSKGLEFPVVFLCGLEEGTFPHSRSLAEDPEVAEERRLCYVGMTRAREELHLSYARVRTTNGSPMGGMRSRFLDDIPAHLLEQDVGASSPARVVVGSRTGTYSVVEAAAPRSVAWDPPFPIGTQVRHPKFGIGVVVACAPLSGDAEVTVAFPGIAGIKKLVHSKAGLEVVGE